VGFFPDPINAGVPLLNLTAMLVLSTPSRHGVEKKAAFAERLSRMLVCR
jgi:hypothetical protein